MVGDQTPIVNLKFLSLKISEISHGNIIATLMKKNDIKLKLITFFFLQC